MRRRIPPRVTSSLRLRFWSRSVGLILCVLLSTVDRGQAAEPLPPRPYVLVPGRFLETPLLEAVPYCAPEGLDPEIDPILEQADAGAWESARELLGEWIRRRETSADALRVLEDVFAAREARDRAARLAIESRLRERLRRQMPSDRALCLRMELARILMLLGRDSEAAGQWALCERLLDASDPTNASRRRALAFGQAEVLYRTGMRFDAHLAYRELAHADAPRLAAAARLRLTDLSFDAGRIENVSLEYEALLPRATAFGASAEGWALRAAEAALAVGDLERGRRWIERFVESETDQEVLDLAMIRQADIDLALGDPIRARARLAEIGRRREGEPLASLAAIRTIDLGVSNETPRERVERLMEIIRVHSQTLRRYALDVLMSELIDREEVEQALIVATRLAYEGVDLVVTPDFGPRMDDLLDRATAVATATATATPSESGRTDCEGILDVLGGRYGMLIERASRIEPFLRVGECFERIELPWLAAPVYRAVSRRFGAAGAERVALPLARSAPSIGELALARRMAEASLAEPGPDETAWRAVLAEVDFRESRIVAAAAGLQAVLDAPELVFERGRLARLLALTFEERNDPEAVSFLAERLPRWLEQAPQGPLARASMLEATLRTAHALRREGWRERARRLYRAIDRNAEDGTLRSSARFWLGVEEEDETIRSSVWGGDPTEALGSPWGRLARFERRFESLAAAYLGDRR